MRKKLTSLFALMFLFGATALHAQSLEIDGTPLITDASQLSSNASDEDEGQHIEYLIDGNTNSFWHTDWHGRCNDKYHYLQVALNEEFTGDAAIWVFRRDWNDDHPTEFLVQGSLDGVTWTDIATVSLPYNGPATSAQSDFFTVTEPVNYLRLNCTNTGVGAYRKFWHTVELQVYTIDHNKKQLIDLNNLLQKYDDYLWGGSFDMGTGFGQYTNIEAEAIFMENLKKVDAISANPQTMPSAEEVDALIKTVEDAYAAIIASEVMFQIPADGYYHIISNLPYYKDVDGERTYVTKAMYSDLAGYGSWGTYDASDCRFLWKLTKDAEDPTVVDMVNAATEYRFKDWTRPITMSKDGQLKVVFDWAGKENGHDIVYVRNSALERNYNAENYLHQLSHNSGVGEGDYMCSWKGTFNMGAVYESDKGSSEWYLEPVSEEEAEALVASYAPYRDHDLMLQKYRELVNQSQNVISKAKDSSLMTKVFKDQPLISDANQLSSLVSERTEGALEYLLDGDASTFWHSDWHGEHPECPIHYLTVEMPEAYEGSMVLYMTRRANCNDDHPVKMQVGASNDGENWTDIALISAPYDGGNTSCTFTSFTLTQPYKFVRFGALDCGGGAGFRTFWHAGEIQLYAANVSGKTQFENIGNVANTLETLTVTGISKNDADVTVADYDALKDAYEAFMEVYVDPTPMTTAMNSAIEYLKYVQIGDAPGFWADDSAEKQALALIDEVQTYRQEGKFGKTVVNDYVNKLNNVKNNLLAQTNKVNPNKWYRIRHLKEEEFTICGATKAYEMLYGQYIAVGKLQNEMVGGAEANVPRSCTTDQTREGQKIYFFDDDQIGDKDAAMFRFVELPDGRYAMQNKASGLYISRGGEEANILMGFTPQSFEVCPIGYGQVLFVMKNLDGSSFNKPNLNAYYHDNFSELRWWDDSNFACNSTFIIEEAEDVDEDYEPVVRKDVVKGQLYPIFCPETVQPSEGTIYQVEGTFVDDEKNYVAMNEIEEASKAGVPFVYMLGMPSDYKKDAPETKTVEFTLGTDFNLQTGTTGGFTGVYSYRNVPVGTIVFSENKVISADATVNGSQDIYGGSGYITFGEVEIDAESSGDYSLVLELGKLAENPLAALGEPLITEASQLSSNASDRDEGQHIEYLIDGNPSTYWHTDWHGDYNVDAHYLQVELNEEFTGDLTVVMTRRNNNDDHPTAMNVLGSLDGENYFTVTSLDFPFDGPASAVVSETFSVSEPIKYLRFVVTNTASTAVGFNFRKFWHTAEFQLYGAKSDAVERIVESKVAQKGIFTINGIRVEKTQQGLYIIDGKKVLVK